MFMFAIFRYANMLLIHYICRARNVVCFVRYIYTIIFPRQRSGRWNLNKSVRRKIRAACRIKAIFGYTLSFKNKLIRQSRNHFHNSVVVVDCTLLQTNVLSKEISISLYGYKRSNFTVSLFDYSFSLFLWTNKDDMLLS